MSQILLCRSQSGISLAVDSRATSFSLQKENRTRALTVQKLFSLSNTVVAATVGAGYGILLVENFMRFIQHAGLSDFESISRSAAAFFQRGTELVRGKNAYSPHCHELDKVYFLIAGIMPGEPKNPFRYLLLASEGRSEPLYVPKASNVVAIPRQLGLEYRVVQLLRSGKSMEEVEHQLERFLLMLADSEDGIGPPFHFAQLTLDGIRIRTRSSMRDSRMDRTALRREVGS